MADPPCCFFEAWPEGGDDMVRNSYHPGPCWFVWPLPEGHAVVIPLCEEHADWLEAHVDR